MTNENQNFAKRFSEFLGEQLTKFMKPARELITFPYGNDGDGQNKKRTMATALIFWQFLRELSHHVIYNDDQEKRGFIADFLANDPLVKKNPYVKTIAMIEALPTTIWRKLLWRENIDFVSYESCLRRLNPEQKKAIEDNYNDLFGSEPKTPRVLKKSLRDRVKLFFGIISTEKILKESRSAVERYMSKGAWAFNLLGIDFGFAMYPKDAEGHHNDDTMITNKKWTRFISVKEHINDFIVNKEDGKYFQAYKSARSNYAFFPGKEIRMKTHVCPGFWKTLITHAWFWIVSPAAIIATIILSAEPLPTWVAFSILLAALPLVLWLLVAFIRLVVNAIIKVTKDNKILQIIGVTILAASLICITGFALFIVVGFLWTSIVFASPVIGPLMSVLFVLTTAFYLYYFFFCLLSSTPQFEYNDIPSFIRFILHFSVAGFAVIMFDKFLATYVISFIVNAATYIWEWYTDDLLLSNWFILTLGFFGLFSYFFNMFLNDEKKFAAYTKTFSWLAKGFTALTVIVFAVLFLKNGNFNITEFGLLPATFLSVIFLLLGAGLMMLDQVNRDNIEEREEVSHFVSRLDFSISGLSYKTYMANIMKSEWLLALNKDKRREMIDRIDILAWEFFGDEPYYRGRLAELLITKGSLNALDILSEGSSAIKARRRKAPDLMFMLTLIIAGASIEGAADAIRAKKESAEKKKNIIETALFIIVAPFVYFFRAIGWTFTKIKQFFLTLTDIWELFNKRCPFITEGRYLG